MPDSNDQLVGKTITIEREFEAPRELVWETWTKPEHFSKWYAPDHFTVPVCELDVRPEGKIRIDMKGPDATVYPSSGVFQEVSKPEHLSFINSPLDADGNKMFEVLQSLTLTDQAGKTQFRLVSKVVSAGPQAAPFLAGMDEGLNQSIKHLEALIQDLSK
jgi:uncharacterized protein YndB with AHSA1/START domain